MKSVEFISNLFSWFCHQEPSRSVFTTSVPLLCARCSGIYTGALFWLVERLSIPSKGKSVQKYPYIVFMFILAALTPMEFLFEKMGFDGGNWFRYWFGILTGIGLMGLCRLPYYSHVGQSRRRPSNLIRVVFLCGTCSLAAICIFANSLALSFVLPTFACLGFIVFVSNLALSIFRLFIGNRNT